MKRLRVPGDVTTLENGAKQLDLGPAGNLRVGGRYVMLLAGGRWGKHGPFVGGGMSLFEVLPDGKVSCGRGFLYDVTSHGFVCGVADDFAADPLDEKELTELLRDLLAKTRRQRPNLHQYHEKNVEPLREEP